MSTRPKRQHTLPRFYLRTYAEGDDLWVYDKLRARAWQARVADVAVRSHFYTRRDDAGNEDFAVEHGLARIEDVLATDHRFVLEKPDECQLSDDHRLHLANLASVLYLRPPEAREHIRQLMVIQRGGGVVTADELKNEHANRLIDAAAWAELAASLAARIIFIGINTTIGMPFFTSDHPVVCCKSDGSMTDTSFGDTSAEIALPLTSNKIAVIGGANSSPLERLDGYSLPCPEPVVTRYNHLQAARSFEQVYSVTDDFDLVKRAAAQDAWIQDSARRRFRID